MLKFDFLIPTHNKLRDPKSIKPMVEFVREGRIFRCADKPIAITQFEDGTMYIRDGHRRLSAMLLAGARGILDCEYIIEQMRYKDYLTPNPQAGWYTPFNPKNECRLADFSSFKKDAIEFALHNYGLVDFCRSGASRYKEARYIESLRDLVKVNFPNGCD